MPAVAELNNPFSIDLRLNGIQPAVTVGDRLEALSVLSGPKSSVHEPDGRARSDHAEQHFVGLPGNRFQRASIVAGQGAVPAAPSRWRVETGPLDPGNAQ